MRSPAGPHVVFLIRSFGFPNGMAATNRARLLAKALRQEGVRVTVFLTRVSERPPSIRNADVTGEWEGIRFLYTTGSTVRSPSFLVRRYRELRGHVVALLRLWVMCRRGAVDCVWLPTGRESWRFGEWLLMRSVALLHVPVIVELNEIPEMLSVLERLPLPDSIRRHVSKLDAADGAVAISSWLTRWAAREARRIGRTIDIIEVPIVADVDEIRPAQGPAEGPLLTFSAMHGYTSTLSFILTALRMVWDKQPECRLIVTGMSRSEVAGVASQCGLTHAVTDGRIVATGYVERPELLAIYGRSAALLIPLLDDAASRARFPSKIAEYLASGRPVVTTRVGEIERYLHDGETAFVSPARAEAFAARVLDVLTDPSRAGRVGLTGRALAEKEFHYALHGPAVRSLVERLSRSRDARRSGTR